MLVTKWILWARKLWPFLASAFTTVLFRAAWRTWVRKRYGTVTHKKESFGSLRGSFPRCSSPRTQLSCVDGSSSLTLSKLGVQALWCRLCFHLGCPAFAVGVQVKQLCTNSTPMCLFTLSSLPLRKKRDIFSTMNRGRTIRDAYVTAAYGLLHVVRALVKLQEFDSGYPLLCSHHLFWL